MTLQVAFKFPKSGEIFSSLIDGESLAPALNQAIIPLACKIALVVGSDLMQVTSTAIAT
jgi:hypothetical protein